MTVARYRLLVPALLIAATLLPACVSYEPEPIVPSASAAQLTARTLDDPGLRELAEVQQRQPTVTWPPVRWNLDDLSLAAYYFHTDMAVAKAQWSVAAAAQVTAGGRPNPGMSVTPAYNSTTGVPSPWIVALGLDLPFETAGKRRLRATEAEHMSNSARLNIATVAWAVRSRLRNSMLELYAAEKQLALLDKQQALQDEHLRMIENQFRAGAISSFELAQARLLAENAHLDLFDTERRRAEARVQLAAAIGVPAAALDDVQLSFTQLREIPDGITNATARRQALANRADVLGALAGYAASQSALQQAVAAQYPDLSIGPGYEYDQGDNKWSLGLALALPVGKRVRGAIREAAARRTESAARFDAVQAGALAEIDIALAGLRRGRQSQAETDAMLTALTNQERRARTMFDAGELSPVELIEQQIQLNTMSMTRFDALIRTMQAASRLESALQTPLAWTVPAEQVESPGQQRGDTGVRP